MHVVLTRPVEDCASMQQQLEAQGIAVSLAPMLEIDVTGINAADLDSATGLIVTSRNALKALARSEALAAAKALPVFAVGKATASLARQLGFATVIEGPGTAAELTPLILGHRLAASGALLHITGNRQAFDLAAALQANGITIRSIETYRSVAAKTIPPAVAGALAERAIDAVILMSPETARSWQANVAALPFKPDTSHVVHLCLSQAVAQALSTDPPQKIEIASRPNAEQMLDLAFRLAAKLPAA